MQEALWERSRIPVRDRKKYACALLPSGPEEWELNPDWDDPGPYLVAYEKPTDIQIVVAGDLYANTIVPTFAYKLGAPCSELIVPGLA